MHQTRLPIELPQPATVEELRERTDWRGSEKMAATNRPVRIYENETWSS